MAQDPNDQSPPVIKEDPALDSLEDRLAAARKTEDARLANDHAPLRAAGESSAWHVASTMVGYPLGGIIIGFLLDNIFDTAPWITISLMFLAFIGACLHVMRTYKNTGSE